MSAAVVFSPEAREALSGLSKSGRERLLSEMESAIRTEPLAESSSRHFHAAGMCCVVKRAGAEESRVVYLSPECREG